MDEHHTRLTRDLPPIVDIPDLPGAKRPERSRAAGGDREPSAGSGHASGAHQEVDGRHERTGEGSGG